MSERPRDEKGRLVSAGCPDPNCGGRLVYEPEQYYHFWRCDGLTHERADDDLEACTHAVIGPPRSP